MDTVNHFDQNRPVHLARRDVFYERVVEMLSSIDEGNSLESQMEQLENILYLLRIARRHARFAVRALGMNPKDREFCKFIELLVDNLKGILSMLKLKCSVEHSEGFFYSFLGINHASVSLQAEEYERRARDIFRCVINTTRLAEEPFMQLKADNYATASESAFIRYNKAHSHFTTLAVEQLSTISHALTADDSAIALLSIDA